MIVLPEQDVAALLPMDTAIELVAGAMQTVSAGGAELPLRSIVNVGGPNKMGVMAGSLSDPSCFGVKLVSLFPGNPAAGLSSHRGAIVLFEPQFGAAVAMMDGGLVTAIRTAAASAVATRALARPQAQVLAIVGAGEQAHHHLDAMLAVRPITQLRIASRTAASAETFANHARAAYPHLSVSSGLDVRAAVEGADIICTVTNAPEPVLEGIWIAAGAHLNVAGASIPSKREIDASAVTRSEIYVDYRLSTFAQAGEIIEALEQGLITRDHIRGEIGEVLSGKVQGRSSDHAITLYRSLGIAAQDLACAHHCWRQAERTGQGTRVPF